MAYGQTPLEEQKERKRKCGPNTPLWMITYADMVTLLLTFFILLLSMASMDPVKFTKASSSIRDALGLHSDPVHIDFTIPVLPSPPITRFSPIRQQTTRKIYEKVESQIDSLRLKDDIGLLKKNNESIILRIKDLVLFKPGQVKISSDGYSTLRTIAKVITPLPMNLRIEGHTDDTRVSAGNYNNWELSVARSISVLRFFAQSDLLPLDRMSSVGYGKKRPIVPNKDEASRALNRRVDFVLRLNTTSSKRDMAPRSAVVPL